MIEFIASDGVGLRRSIHKLQNHYFHTKTRTGFCLERFSKIIIWNSHRRNFFQSIKRFSCDFVPIKLQEIAQQTQTLLQIKKHLNFSGGGRCRPPPPPPLPSLFTALVFIYKIIDFFSGRTRESITLTKTHLIKQQIKMIAQTATTTPWKFSETILLRD